MPPCCRSTEKFCFMETKFIHSGNGCVLTELISENSACFLPSFSLISGILEKIQSNHVKTLVLVPRVATFIKTIIISDFLESKYLKKLNRPDSFINRGQEEASQRSASPEKNIRAGYHLYLNLQKGKLFINLQVALEEVV